MFGHSDKDLPPSDATILPFSYPIWYKQHPWLGDVIILLGSFYVRDGSSFSLVPRRISFTVPHSFVSTVMVMVPARISVISID